MLTAFRRLAGTWFAKGLFLLLILSFGIWGIEDVVRNFGRDSAVARVDGQPIELAEAQAAARRQMAQLQRQLGPDFAINDALRQTAAQQAVAALVNQRIASAESDRMGIAASDQAVRDYVFAIPAFQAGGQFSRAIFNQFLRGNGLDENGFLALVKRELERQQIITSVRAGIHAPDALVKPLLAQAGERRVVELATLPLSDAPEPPAPTEEQLRRFWENNPQQFSTPEYRTATVARLAAEIVMKDVQVTDEEIAQAYAAAGDRFHTPERRTLEQVLFPTGPQAEEEAKALAETWKGGADFAAITGKAKAEGGQPVELGTLSQAEIPVAELARAAFATPEGEVSAPVRSSFGWHVLKVVKVEPPAVRGLDQARDELRNELAQSKAADLAFDRINGAEDALAGGAKLAEAAKQFGMEVGTVTVDATGHAPDGQVASLPVPDYARDETLAAIFAAQPRQPARMEESKAGAGFVGVELDSVQPPAPRPFEQVEDAVRAAWTEDARAHAQEEKAAALLTAVKDGRSLEDAAKEAGVIALRSDPFGRDGRNEAGPRVPPELLNQIFGTKPNDATMVRTAQGFAVAQVLEVTPGDVADASALRAFRGRIESGMGDELEIQYLNALRDRTPVQINEALLPQVAGGMP